MIAPQFKIPLAPSELGAGTVDLNKLVTGGSLNTHFAYEVTGSSCSPHIVAGSIVIVNKYRQPINGDTVAVMLNDHAFVKVFERKDHRLRLVSPNPEYAGIEVRPHDNFEHLGVVEWAIAPVLARDVVYSVSSIDAVGGLFRVRFVSESGEMTLSFPREEMDKGMVMADKALSERVVKFKA